MSTYDPAASDEGRLDPLGFATFADRIADTYAAPVRARMRRVRFASAMCLGTLVTPQVEGIEPAERGDTGELAYERVTVEALARDPGAYSETGIPGISKAHTAVKSGQRLGPRTYLKGSRVFGFHGVYRPFATSLGLVDRDGELHEAGVSVLRAVERDQGLDGLLEPRTGTPGKEFLAWLAEEVRRTLQTGRNAFSARNSTNLPRLVALTRPGGMGRYERRALRQVMDSPTAARNHSDAEAFVEALSIVGAHRLDAGTTEVEGVAKIGAHASPGLHRRLQALDAFEDFARDLNWAFEGYRWLSTVTPGGRPGAAAVSACEPIARAASSLAGKYARATEQLDSLAELGSDPTLGGAFAHAFAAFGGRPSAPELVDLIVAHHMTVQANKAPDGKRPWFEEIDGTWVVRPPFTVYDKPERAPTYLHPYRLFTLNAFLVDLRG
jgi:hypothetical protein